MQTEFYSSLKPGELTLQGAQLPTWLFYTKDVEYQGKRFKEEGM